MDIRKIKKLIELLEESRDLSEIEVHEDAESVRISRTTQIASPAPTQAVQVPASRPAAQPEEQAPADSPEDDLAVSGTVVRSPMVGTFFSAPSPESEPFVQEGDRVAKGDTLCIIEAMKTMNQITTPEDGVVKKIFVKNTDPVEFDQPLFLVE